VVAIPASSARDVDFASPDDTVISQAPPPVPPAPPTAATGAPPSMPLANATAPDMMVEISRRKKSAVLVVFETPSEPDYNLSRRAEANVRCYRTADMSDAQLMQVLEELGRMSEGQRNQKGGIGLSPSGAPPYELKGDRLGMSLSEFKAKYARTIGRIKLPFTSEGTAGQANSALWSEPWHAAAGIVHARVELPSEGTSPTVAGVKTELFLYHFVDEQLFRITVLFDTEAFHLVREALSQKFGPATSETKDPLEITWTNLASTVRLVRGSMRPKKFSTLVLMHHRLQAVAEGRVPQRGADL
jgi:hypothetical protein